SNIVELEKNSLEESTNTEEMNEKAKSHTEDTNMRIFTQQKKLSSIVQTLSYKQVLLKNSKKVELYEEIRDR
ncbi:16361_t:CDS:1, partial [Dentiscutata heterogama]